MRKYLAMILVLSTVLTGCSQVAKLKNVVETQNIVDEEQSNPQVPQDYPQDDDELSTEEQEIVEEVEPVTIINLSELDDDTIIELKQRFLTIDTYLSLDEVIDDAALEAFGEIKIEYDDELEQYEIKSSTLDAFIEETDQYFANTDDGYLMVTNKTLSLRYDYEPENLRVVTALSNRETYLEDQTATAVEAMFDKALEDGIQLIVASGYRDFYYQDGLFSRKVANVGLEDANKVVAMPGESEHQTGYVLDITSVSANWSLEESFENTEEFAWLQENCADFGFILRYMKDKVDITGYSYEPWHYRYIGDVEIANFIMDNGITLEEYHEFYIENE